MTEHCTINAYGKSLRRKGKSAVAVFRAKAPCACACDKLIPSQRGGSGMWIFWYVAREAVWRFQDVS